MGLTVPLVLFAIAAPAWAAVLTYGFAMACLGFLNPTWQTVVQQEIPAEVLARVYAYDWLVSLAAMPLGYVLGPVLGRELGYAWPLTAAAILVLISATLPITQPNGRDLPLRHARPSLRSRPDP